MSIKTLKFTCFLFKNAKTLRITLFNVVYRLILYRLPYDLYRRSKFLLMLKIKFWNISRKRLTRVCNIL